MIKFFESVISALCRLTGSMTAAVTAYALLVCFICIGFSKKNYENILLSDSIGRELVKIRETHKKRPEKETEDISRLMIRYGYGLFQSTVCSLLQLLFGLGLTAGIAKTSLNTSGLFGIDLAQSPAKTVDLVSLSPASVILLAVLPLCLQLLHDWYLNGKVVADQRIQDTVMFVLAAAGAFLLPSAFALYWLIHELFDIFFMFYVTKVSAASFGRKLEKRLAGQSSKADSGNRSAKR